MGYKLSNKIDGKQYVGQTLEKDIFERWKSHFKKVVNVDILNVL